ITASWSITPGGTKKTVFFVPGSVDLEEPAEAEGDDERDDHVTAAPLPRQVPPLLRQAGGELDLHRLELVVRRRRVVERRDRLRAETPALPHAHRETEPPCV